LNKTDDSLLIDDVGDPSASEETFQAAVIGDQWIADVILAAEFMMGFQ